MKKLFALLACILCAAMLATVGFAAEASDAYSVYQRASKNLESATSFEMAGTIRTGMEMEGVELAVVLQNSTVKMLKLPNGDIQMEMCNAVKMIGDDSSDVEHVDVYYKDGYMYTNAGGETSKTKLDIEGAISQANTFDTGLTKEAFKDATMEQTDEGTVITFKVAFDDLTANGAGSMKDVMSELAEGADMELGDVTYSILIGPDNKIKEYNMNFDMDIVVEGVSVSAKTKARYMITSVDRVKSIDFPDGLAAY